MKTLSTALISLLFSPWILASGAVADEYYSKDIFRAIEEARYRTHHYDYSGALRYNRTTSQSIQLPRLLNQEMAQTIIETPDMVDNVVADTSSSSLNLDTSSATPDSVRMLNSPTSINTNASDVSVIIR